jgi:hypothetical protein
MLLPCIYTLLLHRRILQTTPASSLPPLLPPITPTSTIHTPLRLLTNILATKLALDLPLHNIIIRATRVRQRNDPQRQRNAHKPHNLV